MKLSEFVNYLEGNFNNEEQFKKMKENNIKYPFCEHTNTVCNNKIKNLPKDFKGVFMVEESYYTDGDVKRTSPHLFLFEEVSEGIKLTSYEIPDGYNKDTFTYKELKEVDYNELKNNFKIEVFDVNDAVNRIKENIPNNEENKIISPDMISAIEEYLNRVK